MIGPREKGRTLLHEYENELSEDWSFWSNATGDLHHDGLWLDDIEDLPAELQRAFNDLWTDGLWAECYLAEFEGRYGVALEAGYDKELADDAKMTYAKLIDTARTKASRLSKRYPQYEVILGVNTGHWSNGTTETELLLFLPWDVSEVEFSRVAEHFDSTCY